MNDGQADALAYDRSRRQYIDRFMLGDIGRAEPGIGLVERGDPPAAQRLLDFLASEIDFGYTPPPALMQYVKRAVRRAQADYAKKLLAFKRKRPASGAKRPVLDLTQALGLRLATSGAPRQHDGFLEEAVSECLAGVMRGRSREGAERDAAAAVGRSLSLVRKQCDEARPEYWYAVAMQVLSHANDALAVEGLEFSQELDDAEDCFDVRSSLAWQERRVEIAARRARCLAAKNEAILAVAAETGMLPGEIRKAVRALFELLDDVEIKHRRQER
jgi:hypothetical protein